MIQAIFFDLGKVLADFDWKPAAEKIAQHSDIHSGEIYVRCTNSSLALQYETGKIDTKHFFMRLKTELGFRLSTERLMEFWSDIFTPIPENLSILDMVRVKYPVGLISNTNEAHVRWIEEKFGFLKNFPKPTYSFATGYMKPRTEIYLAALASLSVTAEKTLFIDDLEVNTSAAKRLCMHAIHLTKEKNLEKELRKLGLKI
jgi:putative hydrolase of the HAD superfamily